MEIPVMVTTVITFLPVSNPVIEKYGWAPAPEARGPLTALGEQQAPPCTVSSGLGPGAAG